MILLSIIVLYKINKFPGALMYVLVKYWYTKFGNTQYQDIKQNMRRFVQFGTICTILKN